MATKNGSSSSRKPRRTHVIAANPNADAFAIEDKELTSFVVGCADGRGERIRFPRRFTERWGSLIDQDVCINTKDGNRWVVDVERRKGDIWLGRMARFKETYNGNTDKDGATDSPKPL